VNEKFKVLIHSLSLYHDVKYRKKFSPDESGLFYFENEGFP